MNNAEPVTLQIECRAEVAERIVAILELENEPQVATTAEQLEVLEKALLKQTHGLCGLIVEKQIQHSIDSEDNRHLTNTENWPIRMDCYLILWDASLTSIGRFHDLHFGVRTTSKLFDLT